MIGEGPNQDYSNEIQEQIQKDIEVGLNKIATLIDKPKMDEVIIFYFIMVWSRVMGRYGKNGEKHDNTFIKEMINKIMNGDLPTDINNMFAKEKNH